MGDYKGNKENPAGYGSLGENVRALIGTILEHSRIRFQILEIEGKEAGAHYLKLVIFLAAGLLFLLFAYVFLLIGVIFLIAQNTGWSWAGITAVTGGIHLLLAVICLLITKTRFKKTVFETTIQELKQDTKWLREKNKKR